MTFRNKLIAGGATLAVVATSLAGFSSASAQTATGSDSLAEKIASRFNLNQDEVEAVFDEAHQEREAEREVMTSDRLQKAVDSDELTVEQKTLIENKLKEVHEEREAERENLKSWADENNIDRQYIVGGYGHGGAYRLERAAEDGDITADQKKLIEQKQQELKDARDAMRDELEKWAEDNNIDQKYLKLGGHGKRGGPGGGRF